MGGGRGAADLQVGDGANGMLRQSSGRLESCLPLPCCYSSLECSFQHLSVLSQCSSWRVPEATPQRLLCAAPSLAAKRSQQCSLLLRQRPHQDTAGEAVVNVVEQVTRRVQG